MVLRRLINFCLFLGIHSGSLIVKELRKFKAITDGDV